MHGNLKDIGSGSLFMALGAFFAIDSWVNLTIGTAGAMGAGFFPFVLGLLLLGLGTGILAKGLRSAPELLGVIPWRGGVLVLGSILFFALANVPLGSVPALAGSSLLAAFAPSNSTWRSVLVITVLLTAFCVLVFITALGLPYPLFGRWLTGY